MFKDGCTLSWNEIGFIIEDMQGVLDAICDDGKEPLKGIWFKLARFIANMRSEKSYQEKMGEPKNFKDGSWNEFPVGIPVSCS